MEASGRCGIPARAPHYPVLVAPFLLLLSLPASSVFPAVRGASQRERTASGGPDRDHPAAGTAQGGAGAGHTGTDADTQGPAVLGIVRAELQWRGAWLCLGGWRAPSPGDKTLAGLVE